MDGADPPRGSVPTHRPKRATRRKRVSPHPERFGKGTNAGVAGPEGANTIICGVNCLPGDIWIIGISGGVGYTLRKRGNAMAPPRSALLLDDRFGAGIEIFVVVSAAGLSLAIPALVLALGYRRPSSAKPRAAEPPAGRTHPFSDMGCARPAREKRRMVPLAFLF